MLQKSPASKPQAAGAKGRELSFGLHLRHARVARGLRLKALAELAGCSESLLSRIENNKVNPSLHLLQRICIALEMTVADLLVWVESDSDIVTRASERTPVRCSDTAGPGIIMQRLGPFGRRVGGYLNRIEPGGWSGVTKHEGDEIGYVLSGSLEMVVGTRTFQIFAGDSFCFQSDVPHSYRNKGDVEAQIIIVNSPPSF